MEPIRILICLLYTSTLPKMERALVVSQTTCILERFERVCAAMQERVRDMEIRKTICPATRERQEEAVQLAKSVDVMLVVGGKESSNSRKLFELVKAVCPRSHFIEGAREVENTWFQQDVYKRQSTYTASRQMEKSRPNSSAMAAKMKSE